MDTKYFYIIKICQARLHKRQQKNYVISKVTFIVYILYTYVYIDMI